MGAICRQLGRARLSVLAETYGGGVSRRCPDCFLGVSDRDSHEKGDADQPRTHTRVPDDGPAASSPRVGAHPARADTAVAPGGRRTRPRSRRRRGGGRGQSQGSGSAEREGRARAFAAVARSRRAGGWSGSRTPAPTPGRAGRPRGRSAHRRAPGPRARPTPWASGTPWFRRSQGTPHGLGRVWRRYRVRRRASAPRDRQRRRRRTRAARPTRPAVTAATNGRTTSATRSSVPAMVNVPSGERGIS